MKRAFLVGLAVIGLSAAAFAQAPQQRQQAQPQAGQATCPHFVDANGDGVCDNAGQRQGRRGPGMGRGMGAGMAFGRHGLSLVDITAKVAGQDRDAVIAALREGKTFAQVAEAAGKSADDVKQAALTERKARLDEAVKAGRLTAEQADAIMALMTSRLDQQLAGTWPAGHRRGGFRRAPGQGGPTGD
ncbi:MAG: hypothetical protein H6Q10_2353 [Acidobacteria bacterium]|nr:hypothetical protein [Acidobacteriota bacterium]